jgi:glycosyltransferase involved in cell wall biosynthesis
MVELETVINSDDLAVIHHIPRVSIGMPVYNGAAYIRDALDSLLQQTFTDFELIISDNGSTDATQVICNEYVRCDPRVRYVRQDENQGAMANFKFVLDSAQAKLFMWAAYDDLWASNYLMESISLISDQNVDFVFPAFELRSIRLGIAKKFNPEVFKFIESSDRRRRVLHFMALHYLSHSANIVYSLFRTDFLRAAWAIQDIGNDGALGAVVLGLGRGVVGNALFSKRYPTFWPRMIPPVFSIINGWLRRCDITGDTRLAIQVARLKMLSIFPEYADEIAVIYDQYHPHTYDRHYQVCSIRELF